jgi:hypothetical protein
MAICFSLYRLAWLLNSVLSAQTLVDPKLRITEFVSGLSQQTAIKRFFLNSGAGIW